MRFISKSALLALMTTLALSAVVVSSAAAALPEFQKEGKPLTGTVEFTGTSGAMRWTATERYESDSESGTISGKLEGSHAISDATLKASYIHLQACIGKLTGKNLSGEIGYVAKSEKRVGLLLQPTTNPFAICSQELGEMNGSTIAEITPVNKPTTTFKLTYSQYGGYGEPRITHFEGSEVIHCLSTVPFALTIGLSAEFTLTTAKAVEIKA